MAIGTIRRRVKATRAGRERGPVPGLPICRNALFWTRPFPRTGAPRQPVWVSPSYKTESWRFRVSEADGVGRGIRRRSAQLQRLLRFARVHGIPTANRTYK